MTVPRASYGLLRTHIRSRGPATARIPGAATPLRQQTRTKILGQDDLGGPGGQVPRPEAPGGPEAVKRNWLPIGGGAVAILAMYAYFTTGSPKKEEVQKAMRDAKDTTKEAVKSR